VMQASSPVDSNVLLPHINCKFNEHKNNIILTQTASLTKLTSLHLFAVLGHVSIVEQQVVSHADSVGLHWVPLTIRHFSAFWLAFSAHHTRQQRQEADSLYHV
uniref:Uncharacterized protein n=1 Tax=Sander lucioperca TaxID=283035 RepID=A0A8C9X575_SANLU